MLDRGVAELESLGFRTRLRDDINASDRYLAGSLERRLAEFRQMLTDDQVTGILSARGGYGCGHLLPELDLEELRSNPKLFCGASDITLLLAAYAAAGIVAFHGPMVATTIHRGPSGYNRDLFIRMLVEAEAVVFDTTGCEMLREGRASGRLTGGCLSMVVSAVGTDWELDTTDSILVLEDVGEAPYRLDRMLTHLKQAGALDTVRGFVFGEMPGCGKHADQADSAQDLIRRLLDDYDVPILFGFPTGHSDKPNAIVPFGIQAELSLGSDLSFQLLEPAVST